jgi:hypothetical protein
MDWDIQVGAGVPATIGTLGKERTLERLRRGLEWAEKREEVALTSPKG